MNRNRKLDFGALIAIGAMALVCTVFGATPTVHKGDQVFSNAVSFVGGVSGSGIVTGVIAGVGMTVSNLNDGRLILEAPNVITNLVAGDNVTVTNLGNGTWRIAAAVTNGGSVLPPAAEFSAWPTNGNAPLEVLFSNQTTGTATNYIWLFGDGGSTNVPDARDILYTYVSAGTNTVTLIAEGPGGTSTNTKPGLITVADVGYALEFDGSQNYVGVSDLNSGLWPTSGAWTVEFWIKKTNTQEGNIVAKMEGWGYSGFSVNGGNNYICFQPHHYTYGASWAVPINNGQWHHVAGVIDSENKVLLFFDGTLVASNVLGDVRQPNSSPLWLGAAPEYGGSGFVSCTLDLVRISSTNRYSTTFTPPTDMTPDAATLLLYKFNEGAGTTATDSSGNGYHGALIGDPPPSWVPGR